MVIKNEDGDAQSGIESLLTRTWKSLSLRDIKSKRSFSYDFFNASSISSSQLIL